MSDTKKIRKFTEEVKPTQEVNITEDSQSQSTIADAIRYNKTYRQVNPSYLNIQVPRGVALVRLSMSEVLKEEWISVHPETGKYESTATCYFSQGATKKGWGIMVVDGSKEYECGKGIVVSPQVIYDSNTLCMSPVFAYSDPVHSDIGYFLIPRQMIMSYYDLPSLTQEETKTT